jgi:hypothetical protein
MLLVIVLVVSHYSTTVYLMKYLMDLLCKVLMVQP